jgi:hypothetical protein
VGARRHCATNIACLKRLVEETTSPAVRNGQHPRYRSTLPTMSGGIQPRVPIKYRDAGTATRGRGAGGWRVAQVKQDAGADIGSIR